MKSMIYVCLLFSLLAPSQCLCQTFQVTYLSPVEIPWGTEEAAISYTDPDNFNVREPIDCNLTAVDNNGNYIVADCLDQTRKLYDRSGHFLSKVYLAPLSLTV